MSKLPKEYRFLDLSDYGRPFARIIAEFLKNTSFTPIHITLAFVVCGILAIICILNQYYWATAFFLILKSILDAADGELARLKETPSYTGRYLDSVSDILLNLLILLTIWYVTNGSLVLTFLAFFGIQLQGTLYNYYYVILRNKHNGDTTSRIFEEETPLAMKGEKQRNVNILFGMYSLLYGVFDKIIYRLDRGAVESENLPNWFMTVVSTFGLGFQLLVIGVMLVLGIKEYIIPFFIGYSLLIFVFIAVRRLINR
ncbi:CDP-alcohol phosphatidyltransferase family protein [Flavobacteriaceae bacterium TP-CH-4]|uniref:CDP-alcohol phosphatidyltransferase family protein n=1 Tax=Pelagihabitans pacificus TaxID=2696054 RepID=A0A967AUI4_9FLAO|nr:CDP-alcohol phosphatidyltransferase family protein [Pelagihabitans pacificus]NHF59440.1 CDP-alcohol phosphatidyltransferase family protein [Pelagihabitans pacificus]